MTAAGFDAAAGDTWAVNQPSSAVRTGTGVARQNAVEFLRGLASDGVKGIVFMQGIGQSTADTTTYKLALQSWFGDSAFWSAASGYVRDWAQENYGDLRTYAVAGTSAHTRRDQEAQYLGHELALANAGPASVAAARSFLDSTYVAFGNAAWAWPSAYGWTAAPLANMEDFVSGQVYAARSLGAPSGVDRLGFAWSPSNTLGLSDADFTAQTGARPRTGSRQRSATAARARRRPAHPRGARHPSPARHSQPRGRGSRRGLRRPPSSQARRRRSPPGLPPRSPFSFRPAGIAQNADSAQTVTFATTSSGGTFSPSATVTIPAGSSSVTVTYADTEPGTPTVPAALAGQAPVTQVETVTAPPPPPPPAPSPPPPPAPPPPTPAPTPTPPVVVPKPAPPTASVSVRRVNGHIVATVVVKPHVRAVITLRVRRGSSIVAVRSRRARQ